ncbi:hypothetical protein EKO27_g504 [Xylaria grammica]|uniref:DUF7735 domain-containing protein n=1 Tax=Xylaria grammica TaxID=363999 RepID=A0A439DJJ1_9PEZI|nr:hypothetical protein EKO27_g504 [Xylaria grammica]
MYNKKTLLILAGAPTPNSDLASAITSYASGAAQSTTSGANANPLSLVTQVCDFSSNLPTSLQSDFDAYATSVISYLSASSSEIDAVITNCVATGSEGASYTSFVNSLATHTGALCQATGSSNGTITSSSTATSTGAGGAGDTGSVTTGGGGTATNGGASTSIPTGAAAQPTALYGGAAAAAGFLGAVMLL